VLIDAIRALVHPVNATVHHPPISGSALPKSTYAA
jgi:hypothetical protein